MLVRGELLLLLLRRLDVRGIWIVAVTVAHEHRRGYNPEKGTAESSGGSGK